MNEFPEREWTQTKPPLDKYDGKLFASCDIGNKFTGNTVKIAKIGEHLAYYRHFEAGDEYYYGLRKVWWYGPIELPELPRE